MCAIHFLPDDEALMHTTLEKPRTASPSYPAMLFADCSVSLLHSDIDEALDVLFDAACELHLLQSELHEFLHDYYGAVGELFVTLELLKHHIAAPQKPFSIASTTHTQSFAAHYR